MKYLILLHNNPTSWKHPMFLHQDKELSAEERDARMAEFGMLMEEISKSGELVDAQPLADPVLGRTVRMRDGALAVTDGPFADSKEQMAGYFVVDCDSMDRAVEIASRFPDTRDGVAEVRPIMDQSGSEM
ncbi:MULTISPECIES: YciI family protein [Streptomyces]|uniref:YciI family protein n=2 Tax=Streptomyces TaxID=1883 RepID=A0A939FP03_9ACTN|nr:MULTISPECIES: YciI family protein [Streptomyces]MBO0655520.1 YciI family protein [Streptomyces triculaminicus]QSY50649.1 YciI family protein [Streptomyces griseocarneus]